MIVFQEEEDSKPKAPKRKRKGSSAVGSDSDWWTLWPITRQLPQRHSAKQPLWPLEEAPPPPNDRHWPPREARGSETQQTLKHVVNWLHMTKLTLSSRSKVTAWLPWCTGRRNHELWTNRLILTQGTRRRWWWRWWWWWWVKMFVETSIFSFFFWGGILDSYCGGFGLPAVFRSSFLFVLLQ